MKNQIYKMAEGSKVSPNGTILFVCMKNTFHSGMSTRQRIEHTLGDWRISKEKLDLINKDLEDGRKVYVVGVGHDQYGDYAVKTCFEVYRFFTYQDPEGNTRTVFNHYQEWRFGEIGLKYIGSNFGQGYGTVKIVRNF